MVIYKYKGGEDLLFNFSLEVALISMILAQLLKPILVYISHKKWVPSLLLSTGGMPSSHSAFAASLTLAIALTEGVNSPLFAISFVFAGVVVHDSIGIRREAGKQANVLNQMRGDLLDIRRALKGEMGEKKEVITHLKELLGHEPLEAFFGVMLGVIMTLLFYFFIL